MSVRVQETTELGPIIGTRASDFVLQDYELNPRDLDSLMYEHGVVIGFIKDIWVPASIRRILFMQKHHRKFHEAGVNIALIIADQPHTLHSFHLSSEVKVNVPLLADPELEAHTLYNMQHPGLVLVDRQHTIRKKWLIPEECVWLRSKELLTQVHTTLGNI